jgi:alkyldihydroxyacetonephosphate synthase
MNRLSQQALTVPFSNGATRLNSSTPHSGLVKLMLDTFKMSCTDFLVPDNLALEKVEIEVPVKLAQKHLDKFTAICGAENLRTDTYTRIKKSYGGGAIDALRLRKHIVENIADVVVAPRTQQEIESLVAYCDKERIPMYVFGGGSTVTRGMEAVKGGVTIDMSVHINQVVRFNEIDQTITVQAGMSGPALEDLLNNAPENLGAKRRYTCGHFPQSFEYSSVGGWVVTRGAGQNSTYYGKIEDIVIAQEYVTPRGVFKTNEIPRCATGPDFDQIMMGSEGTFGILTNVTLQLRRYLRKTAAATVICSRTGRTPGRLPRDHAGGFGFPQFSASPTPKNPMCHELYHIEGTIADTVLKLFGYQPCKNACCWAYRRRTRLFSPRQPQDPPDRAQHGAFDISFAPVTSNWEKAASATHTCAKICRTLASHRYP